MELKYLPILLVIISSTFYHICQKSTPSNMNPIVALIITYFFALVVSVVVFFLFVPKISLFESLKATNWASVLLGFAVVGLELGFLLSYRMGWNISVTGLLSNTLVALLLIPIGLFLYHEAISFTSASGVTLCLAGLVLISKG